MLNHNKIIADGVMMSQDPNPFENEYSRKGASKFYAYLNLEQSNKSTYESILKTSTNKILLEIINIQRI